MGRVVEQTCVWMQASYFGQYEYFGWLIEHCMVARGEVFGQLEADGPQPRSSATRGGGEADTNPSQTVGEWRE